MFGGVAIHATAEQTSNTQKHSAASLPSLPPLSPMLTAISLSASPPEVGRARYVMLGSISPVNRQIAPQLGTQSGEMEPVLQTAQAVPVQDAWADILARYVATDMQGLARFDYAALHASKDDMQALDTYIAKQVDKTPSTMPRDVAMVYWANLYNALTVHVVAENYPVKSIRDIKSGFRKGPWKRKLARVEGENLSLDNIEHDILRPNFQTPLVHYMVNCASIGCPNLKTSPWRAETLQVDMEIAARSYINSARGVSFQKNKLVVSSIYKWFKKDFGGTHAGVLAHLGRYADAPLKQKLEAYRKINKYNYDWSVNAPQISDKMIK